MDRFERVIVLLILFGLGFLLYCISELKDFGFWGKAISTGILNAATLLSIYLFLKDKEQR